ERGIRPADPADGERVATRIDAKITRVERARLQLHRRKLYMLFAHQDRHTQTVADFGEPLTDAIVRGVIQPEGAVVGAGVGRGPIAGSVVGADAGLVTVGRSTV